MTNPMRYYPAGMTGVNSLTHLVTNLTKKAASVSTNPSYKEILASLQATSGDTAVSAVGGAKSTTEMTMEEYQEYIWAKIDSFPFSPTRPYDEETIKISDTCWDRMKNDAEYEERMMRIIKDGRAYADPFFGMGSQGTYWILEFDGGEGCHSHGFSKNFGGSRSAAERQFERESEGGFWTSRAKRAKLQRERQKALDARYYEQQRNMKEINDQLGRMRTLKAKPMDPNGILPEMPIVGVPAEGFPAGLSMWL